MGFQLAFESENVFAQSNLKISNLNCEIKPIIF